VMRLSPPETVSKYKFTILKIRDGDGRYLEKSKNLNTFATD